MFDHDAKLVLAKYRSQMNNSSINSFKNLIATSNYYEKTVKSFTMKKTMSYAGMDGFETN
jgi:hypothetical protein